MTRFWGLRGSKLNAAIWGEACFAVIIFGYNQSAAGGVLGDAIFAERFPALDTLNTTGAQKRHNSTIQGRLDVFLLSRENSLADILDPPCTQGRSLQRTRC